MNSDIQLACFNIGEDVFALDIMLIKEIILFRRVTHIPRAPEFIEGVINLRKSVFPIIDLRKRLGFPPLEPTKLTRIILIKFVDKTIGIIVDSVSKVLRVDRSEIEPAPNLSSGIGSEYLKGIVRDSDDLLLFLDIEKLLTSREKVSLQEIASSDELIGEDT